MSDMKTIIISMALIISAGLCAMGQNADSATGSKKLFDYRWEVKLNLHLPALKPQAIQFTIVEFDPVKQFVKDVDLDYYKETQQAAKSKEEKEQERINFLYAFWDLLFNKVDGYNVFLLTNKGMTYVQTITNMDSLPAEPSKWLFSKVLFIKNKPYVYVIQLQPYQGAKLNCKLDKTNLISLDELFDENFKDKLQSENYVK
jgi:hypothetical protein